MTLHSLWITQHYGMMFTFVVSKQAVKGLSRKEADSVAELMAHRPETQRMYYVADQNLREKVRASKNLSAVMQSVSV